LGNGRLALVFQGGTFHSPNGTLKGSNGSHGSVHVPIHVLFTSFFTYFFTSFFTSFFTTVFTTFFTPPFTVPNVVKNDVKNFVKNDVKNFVKDVVKNVVKYVVDRRECVKLIGVRYSGTDFSAIQRSFSAWPSFAFWRSHARSRMKPTSSSVTDSFD